MTDIELDILENKLKELREERETIIRKRGELSIPPASEVREGEDLKPFFYKGNIAEKDDLDNQLFEKDQEIKFLQERIRIIKLGI